MRRGTSEKPEIVKKGSDLLEGLVYFIFRSDFFPVFRAFSDEFFIKFINEFPAALWTLDTGPPDGL